MFEIEKDERDSKSEADVDLQLFIHRYEAWKTLHKHKRQEQLTKEIKQGQQGAFGQGIPSGYSPNPAYHEGQQVELADEPAEIFELVPENEDDLAEIFEMMQEAGINP